VADVTPVAPGFIGEVPEYYDRYLGPLLYTPCAHDFAGRVRLPERARVLELACGTGRLTRELLAVAGPEVRVTATDVAEDMLSLARRLVQDPRVEWRRADAVALPFPDRSFDVVVSQLGVPFFTDKVAAAAEARRVLGPGGQFLLSTWGRAEDNPFARIVQDVTEACFRADTPDFYSVPWSYGDRRQIEGDLRAAGFRDVGIQAVDLVSRAPSAEHAAMGLVHGTPMAHVIAERGSMSVAVFAALVSAALQREWGTAPLAVPMCAWMVVAR
jgi:ubiquinone/menaquinone biosynthesis C-methylase UbiE